LPTYETWLGALDGVDVKEIADILDCPEGTVKSRIFYAIEMLSKKLTTFKNNVIYEHTK
jgi:RNA polymerase sigma-70 factor (ECF subfamily)